MWVCAVALLWPVCGLAANAGDGNSPPAPIRITSDNMTYSQEQRLVIFTGDVVARKEGMEVRSQKLDIYLKEQSPEQAEQAEQTGSAGPAGAGAGDIERIVATGDVSVFSDGREGYGEKVTYYMDREVIIFEGDARLVEDKNEISGDIIRLFMAENRSEVEGGFNKRVEATFFESAVQNDDADTDEGVDAQAEEEQVAPTTDEPQPQKADRSLRMDDALFAPAGEADTATEEGE